MSYDNWNGYFYHNENQVVQIENAPLSLKSNTIEWTHASCMSNLQNEIALEKEYALFLEEIGKIKRIDKNNYEYASFIEEIGNINCIEKNDCNAYVTYARESFICTDSLIICNDNTSSCCEVEDMDISSDDESSNSVTIINNNNIDYSNKNKEIEDELDNLRGMKCQAPFKYGFSRTILCNAVIISFTLETTTFPMSLDNVLVTVLFLNPTSYPMVPCKYWADNKCMYSDQDCEFSHGTQIPLTSIANYIEPNYEHLRRGSLVLANTFKNCLWSKAVVLDIEYGTSINNGTCVVRYSTKGLGVAKVPMHDIYPWVNKYEFVDYNNMGKIFGRKETKLGSEESLGDWEKYTKGIGSKIMAKMGYIKGTGLGKNNEGRVEPVVATVLPKRQSLDYCIAVENKNHRTYLQKKPKKLICFERSVE